MKKNTSASHGDDFSSQIKEVDFSSLIKELEEIELKLRKLEVIERMTESLGAFEMKMLNNVIKSSEKINGKKY